jgi:Do/DeqQ family serine protease
MKRFLSLVGAGIVGGAVSFGMIKWSEYRGTEDVALVQSAPVHQVNFTPGNPESGVDFTTAAEKTVNAVVHIRTVEDVQNQRYAYDPFRDFFFGNPYAQRKPAEGSGSGVIISEDGYIVTNNHVVDGASKIEVTLNDKRKYTATVKGTDPLTDLALLKIEEKTLPFIQFANSDAVKVGEWVLAVGNPFNLTSTVTAGIVSAKARKIDVIHKDLAIESFIQTDAAVNPGNSGGALVNTYGDLIGINSAIASNTGSYTGYSFAIPSNLVKKVINDLAEFGRVQRAFLGIVIKDINSDLAKDKGITDLNGVYVDDVTEGGSAKDAGIKKGDIIRKINDAPVPNFTAFQEQVGLYRPGDKVQVQVDRGGEKITMTVTLKNKDGNTSLFKRNDEYMNLLGADFEEFTNSYGNVQGLRVTRIKTGKLKAVGVREGFLITKINNKSVRNKEEMVNAVSESDGSVYIEGIYPTGEKAYYAFGL